MVSQRKETGIGLPGRREGGKKPQIHTDRFLCYLLISTSNIPGVSNNKTGFVIYKACFIYIVIFE